MAKEDFCFTYYDGDAARDKAHMTRLERGAYDDIISAQRKRGHLSIEDIKRVLSRDFDTCWPSLDWILKKDGAGKYFIEWVDKSLEKMRSHSKKQKDKAEKRWNNHGNAAEMPRHNHSTETALPLESGDGNGDGNEKTKKVPVGIVPEMMQQFAAANPEYPFDQETDFPALREIADKICKWEKLPGDLTAPKNAGTVKRRWGELVPFIRADQHYSGYSLVRINKHFQSIVQSHVNGRNQTNRATITGSTGKPGTSEARVRAARDY